MNEANTTKIELTISNRDAKQAAAILKDLGSFNLSYDCKIERTWTNIWDFTFFGDSQEEKQEELRSFLNDLFIQQGISEFELINQ